MAYPLGATITMDSKADKFAVMAVGIVICLLMETPSSSPLVETRRRVTAEANYLV